MARDSRMQVRSDARASGMVTSQRVLVTPAWSTLRTRTVGLATRTSDTSKGSTVRVIHADGTEEIRTVASFRKDRPATKVAKQTSRRKLTQVEQMGLTNNIGRDYS